MRKLIEECHASRLFCKVYNSNNEELTLIKDWIEEDDELRVVYGRKLVTKVENKDLYLVWERNKDIDVTIVKSIEEVIFHLLHQSTIPNDYNMLVKREDRDINLKFSSK